MIKYIALPTWILFYIVRPFLPLSHPWKNKRFGLGDWFDNQTAACKQFDAIFWALMMVPAMLVFKAITGK